MSSQGDAQKPGAKVLVVDDNEANRLLARDTVGDEGYRVVLAAGGAEGIASFQNEQPDCVLLDMRMPDLDGFAVHEPTRALPRGALRSALEAERVRADADLLRRTLGSLVENAIRHAPRETLVVVAAPRRGGAVEIRVADARPGIPLEMRQKVFDAFVQLEPGERWPASQGRGLGLTFCKFAAQAHGGQWWVEDAAPGAVFCLRLPDVR